MRIVSRNIAVILLVVMVITGCGNNSTEPESSDLPQLLIEVENLSINTDETAEITLRLENIPETIFGVSLQLSYDNSVLSFTDSTAVTAGDYFGDNIILFVQDDNSVVHLSVTRLQGQDGVDGTGDICSINFTSEQSGDCNFEISEDDLNFYDTDGSLISIDSLEISSAEVHVN